MIVNNGGITYEQFLKIEKESNDYLEFIDGEIYTLSTPLVIHQLVVTNLSTEFGNYFKGKECRHFVAPFDIILISDGKPYSVKPDLTVICDKNGLGEQNYKGIPTLVVEVLSPSTASVDFIKKMNIYMKSGIREYWTISPQNNTVQIFSLNESGNYSEPTIYSKKDLVKSVIFKDLEIEIEHIFE